MTIEQTINELQSMTFEYSKENAKKAFDLVSDCIKSNHSDIPFDDYLFIEKKQELLLELCNDDKDYFVFRKFYNDALMNIVSKLGQMVKT